MLAWNDAKDISFVQKCDGLSRATEMSSKAASVSSTAARLRKAARLSKAARRVVRLSMVMQGRVRHMC